MSASPKKILIIEDEIPMAKTLELKLARLGFDVRIASDGEQGLNLIEQQPFDLILLDLIMPQKDGFSVLAELKEKKIKIPVIVHSSLSQPEDIGRVKGLGAIEYFVKYHDPISDMVDYIKSLLNV